MSGPRSPPAPSPLLPSAAARAVARAARAVGTGRDAGGAGGRAGVACAARRDRRRGDARQGAQPLGRRTEMIGQRTPRAGRDAPDTNVLLELARPVDDL